MPIRRIIEVLMDTTREYGNPTEWVEPPYIFAEQITANGVAYRVVTTGHLQRIIYSSTIAHLDSVSAQKRNAIVASLMAFNSDFRQLLSFGYSRADDGVTLSGEVVAELANVGYVLKLCLEMRTTLLSRLSDLPSVLQPYTGRK